MTPIVTSVFTAADSLRAAHLAAEVRRLHVALAQAHERIAAYEERLDYLQRRSEAAESPGFRPRKEAV
jgi:hypothetical protein